MPAQRSVKQNAIALARGQTEPRPRPGSGIDCSLQPVLNQSASTDVWLCSLPYVAPMPHELMSNRRKPLSDTEVYSLLFIGACIGIGAFVGFLAMGDSAFLEGMANLLETSAPLFGALLGMLFGLGMVGLGSMGIKVFKWLRFQMGFGPRPAEQAEPTRAPRDPSVPSPLTDNLNAVRETGPRLDAALVRARRLDVCTSYVSMAGLERLVGWLDSMDPKCRARLLLGMAPRKWRYGPVNPRAAAFFLAQHLDYNPAADSVLRRLDHHREAGRLELRLRLTQPAALHAKLYVWTDAAGSPASLIGSSNLTKGGLGGQGELNVHVQRAAGIRYLVEWFDGRWQEPESFAAPALLENTRKVVRDKRRPTPAPVPN